MEIEIRRPDDWHLHLRDGAAMEAVLPFTAARFARAIVMPNLKSPVTTTAAAIEYRARIVAAWRGWLTLLCAVPVRPFRQRWRTMSLWDR